MFRDVPGVEERLQRRYRQLVSEHLSEAQSLAAGLRALPGEASAFASTQAAWRFYSNPTCTLPQLAEPLIQSVRDQAGEACDQWLLIGLDWSRLHYAHHPAKKDRIALTSQKDLGYSLLTALAISDRDGSPLAPVALELEAADGIHSTRRARPLAASSHLDSLRPLMRHVQQQDLGRPVVWIIDREADSVGHYRRWTQEGQYLLVRAKDRPRVLHEGVQRTLGQVADQLHQQGQFRQSREVLLDGKPVQQWVAETRVELRRPARQHRVGKDGKARHKNRAGPALSMRLVVSEVRDEQDRVLARWLLLTNLPESVSAETIALWYYWRWRIESYHKLLKGAGQQLESWQQETPEAIARRLAVVAMAAVVVWRLARDERAEAEQLRTVLVRLSGRQMKRGKNAPGFTEPALLAGLGVLVPMLVLLEDYDVADLRRMAKAVLPRIYRGTG